MKIYLIGLPGVGKSRIGFKLAEKLHLDFFDVDQLIEREEKKTPKEIIVKFGIKYFRELETKVLRDLRNVSGVVSCGGGIVETAENKLYMSGIVVYLEVDPNQIKFSSDDLDSRPILKERGIVELFLERECQYLSFSNLIISINNKNDEEIITEVLKKI